MDVVKEREYNTLKIILSKALYDKDAILSAAYALSGKYGIRIESESDDSFIVPIEPLERRKEIDLKEVEHWFNNELIDQQLRLNLDKRYGQIRELIIKHAFSPLENLKAETKKIVGSE